MNAQASPVSHFLLKTFFFLSFSLTLRMVILEIKEDLFCPCCL